MVVKSLKQYEGWGISLLDRYRTDLFFRTTCHIIVLQIVLTIIIIVGLWFVMEHLMKMTQYTIATSITEGLKGQPITSDSVSDRLEDVRIDQFWPMVILATTLILCFGFIMSYVALTPTRRSLERKKRFIGNVAHELRTPLAVIRTNTDVALLNKNVPETLRNTLEHNIAELDRVSEIMNNLLSLSNFMRYEHMQFEAVNLSEVAKRAIDTLSEMGQRKHVTFMLQTRTDQSVLGNAIALEQVAFNLLKNAISHTKAYSVITVTIVPALVGKYINMTVADSGEGIAREDLFHVFEPFYRGHNKPAQGGRGLGLAIVNEIVQMHHGKISIRSSTQRGTTVIVSIPKSIPSGVAGEVEQGEEEEVSADFSNSN